MTNASIYYGNGAITVIDHAHIDERGLLIGGTFSTGAIVSGELEAEEQVVMDFSTSKKLIKTILDDKELGIDHKLVIGPWSNCTYKIVDGQVNIETPEWSISVPRNAVHFVEKTDKVSKYEDFNEFATQYVQKEFDKRNTHIKVELINTKDILTLNKNLPTAYFRYVHGLKSSTSWGCQNIAHGHLSYIQIEADWANERAVTRLVDKIAEDLDNTVFIYRDNLRSLKFIDPLVIEYKTERGTFVLAQKSELNPLQKIAVLQTETTVEHLVDYVASTYEKELKELNVKTLYVSEGLAKGAIIRY